jgi:hypothetical protein
MVKLGDNGARDADLVGSLVRLTRVGKYNDRQYNYGADVLQTARRGQTKLSGTLVVGIDIPWGETNEDMIATLPSIDTLDEGYLPPIEE